MEPAAARLAGLDEEEPSLKIAIHAHVGMPDQFLEQLRTGVLDVAVLYAPKLLPGFKVELSTRSNSFWSDCGQRCGAVAPRTMCYVDWGPQFAAQRRQSRRLRRAGVMVGLGPLGLSYLLRAGGLGYFRKGAATPHIEAALAGAGRRRTGIHLSGLCRLSGSKRGASGRGGGATWIEASCEMIVAPGAKPRFALMEGSQRLQ